MGVRNGNFFSQSGLNPGNPYYRLRRNVRLLENYLGGVFPLIKEDSKTKTAFDSLRWLIREIRRKPNILLLGTFDAGKSTLANVLLGKNYLPADFQPMTRVPAHIRHLEDRPSWIADEVWLMDAGFEPRRWDEREYCIEHKVKGGGLGLLDEYGTHNGEMSHLEGEYYALIFLDVPLLKACTLIDVPGFENDDSDTAYAKSHETAADVVFYLSPVMGFCRGGDVYRLGRVIKRLPAFERENVDFPTLGNLFVVATHANPKQFDSSRSQSIFAKASARLYKTLGDTAIQERKKIIQREITPDDVKSRYYTFWVDGQEIVGNFIDKFRLLLEEQIPRIWYERAEKQITEFRSSAVKPFAEIIDDYRERLEKLETLERVYNQYLAQEPARKEAVSQKKANVHDAINQLSRQSIEELRQYYETATSVDKLTSDIKDRYSDKKEGQEYACVYIMEKLEKRLKEILTPKTEYICCLTDKFLSEYKSSKFLQGEAINAGISFDEVAAFAVGAHTLGSLGALGALVGGGWLAANTTGVLAAIGSGLGYAGLAVIQVLNSVVSFFGPVGWTVVVGVAVLGWLFRGPWQKRLAQKIQETLCEKGVLSKLKAAVSSYWDSTRDAFDKGAEETERRWQECLEEMRGQIEHPEEGRINIEATLKLLEEAKVFFEEIPWEDNYQEVNLDVLKAKSYVFV